MWECSFLTEITSNAATHRLNVWHCGFFCYLINKIPFNVVLKIKKRRQRGGGYINWFVQSWKPWEKFWFASFFTCEAVAAV